MRRIIPAHFSLSEINYIDWTLVFGYVIILINKFYDESPEECDVDGQIVQLLHMIAASIQEAGLDPYAQITGYIRTGNDRYITRNGNARELIKDVDRRILKQFAAYLKENK